MAIPSIQQLASLALVSPAQQDMLAHEIRGLDQAINGKRSMHDPLAPFQDGDPIDMSLFDRGARETPDVPVPDINVLRDQLARNKDTLTRGLPPEFSPQQKNQLWQLAKELREQVRHGMPSSEQLERPTQENLDVFMRHQERTMAKQLALRNIIRILDPRDETVVLESLRPVEPSRINWQEYYGRFDDIYMSSQADLERELTALDEETYQKYLTLRLKGIETPKLLMRTLNLSQGVFEACKLRLERELAAFDLEDEAPVPTRRSTNGTQEAYTPTEAKRVLSYARRHPDAALKDVARMCKVSHTKARAILATRPAPAEEPMDLAAFAASA